MSFIVVSAGHSGTKFLARELNRSTGWNVMHEPDESIHPDIVNKRFCGKTKYGEVNSWLLSSAMEIDATRKAVLLRNPYDILLSILRSSCVSDSPLASLIYVRESMARMDSLIRHGFDLIRFDRVTTDQEYLVESAASLGVNLELSRVDMTPVNQHIGNYVEMILSDVVRSEFDLYCDYYDLWTVANVK